MMDPEYVVEEIPGNKGIKGKTIYLLKWTGYEDESWEPRSNFSNVTDVLAKYFLTSSSSFP